MRSAPATKITGPWGVCSSTPTSSTQDRPMGLGRKGDRVANTPIRALPPSRGGRTVGDQGLPTHWENSQMSHRWEKPSKPRSASGLRYSGAKTMVARSSRTSPAWRGTPNLLVKSV